MLGGEFAMRFLETEDSAERALLQALARDTRELQRKADQERAIQTSNAIMKGLGG